MDAGLFAPTLVLNAYWSKKKGWRSKLTVLFS